MGDTDPRTEQLLALLQKSLGHELPNQLLAIQGLARVLDMEEGERLGAEGKDFLSRLAAAAQRTHELIRMLAEFIRASRRTPLDRPTLLATVVAQAVLDAGARSTVPGGQVAGASSIEYDLPKEDLFLSIPSATLHRVFVELLRHASRAAPAGQKTCIRIGAHVMEGLVDVWVADNGRGLAPEELARMFEPFARRPAWSGGTGLELILARHLVETWGGSLLVQSTPEHGSTFTVKLPVAAGRACPGN